MAVALIPGMAAREVAVGALATVYAVSGQGEGGLGISLAHHWSLASALAFLAWYVFAPQCASTLAVVKRETNSWRWPIIMFAYMITLAYIAAVVVYQTAAALGAG
jgi:ferrous iron transport protein B